ncbi:hypothetical protein RhiirA5_427911 [Rhizophagus irregularis]|uniref:Uncharacterized protein n=1 Tax=Rhizophagus irregularis TaxID=588596 RepID=A0A2N0P1F0_9GLOM|nr:hypothetical protein RhiirA5_427911 [Rhizophagus irregularis]
MSRNKKKSNESIVNQYEKSAAKNKPSDKKIVEVDRGQTSTTPNTGQTSTPKKSRYIDCFALFRSVIQRYNNSDYEKLKREHSRLRDEHAYLQGRMCEVYRELKEIKGELNELQQDYIKLHSHNKYINHENEVLRAEINNFKSQISSQDDADVESSESESNDNDNRPGKKRKVARRQIDQSDDDSETDEENARVR